MISWKELFKLCVFVEGLNLLVCLGFCLYEYLTGGDAITFTTFLQTSAVVIGSTILAVLITPLANWWFK